MVEPRRLQELVRLNYAQFKSFRDLLGFVVSSQIPFIHHVTVGGREVYFIQLIGMAERVVYYVEMGEAIKERYVCFNRFKDQITFTNRIETDPQSITLPILEIERTNVFTEYPPK